MNDLSTMRRDRDRAKYSHRAITENAWVCQTPAFLGQLRAAYVAIKETNRASLMHYARLCIETGKREHDECCKPYSRCHWKWSEEKLKQWLNEELEKHREETRRNREAGAKQAVSTRKATALAAEADREYKAELAAIVAAPIYDNDNH